MATEAAIQAQLDAAMVAPKSFGLGDMSATAQSIPDLIAMEKHRANKAGHRFGFGIRPLQPPVH